MVQTGLGNGDKEQTRGWSCSLAVEELSVNLRQELRVRKHIRQCPTVKTEVILGISNRELSLRNQLQVNVVKIRGRKRVW